MLTPENVSINTREMDEMYTIKIDIINPFIKSLHKIIIIIKKSS